MNVRNVAIMPVALLVRAPILLLAYGLIWIGQLLESIGGRVPGLKSDSQP